jgi:hypothetical protein
MGTVEDLTLVDGGVYVQLSHCGTPREDVCFPFPTYQDKTWGFLIADPQFYHSHKSNLGSLFQTAAFHIAFNVSLHSK